MIKLLDLLREEKLFKENKQYILETLKQAKMYVKQGKLSSEDLNTLIKLSPDPKYLGWLAKIWIAERPDIDDLSNNIKEYDVFEKRGKVLTKDINQFKTFEDLYNEVNQIKTSGTGESRRSSENKYDITRDDNDLYIASPKTPEASHKLGLSKFAFRICKDGKKDSAWCTTHINIDHFNNYYYKNGIEFYYIKVRSEELMNELKEAFPEKHPKKQPGKNEELTEGEAMEVVALAVFPDNKIDAYDGLDKQMSKSEIKKFLKIIGY
jgi:hypothetical protein